MGISDYAKTLTGESPFILTFDTEVVLPLEVVFPILWVKSFEEDSSGQGLRENLDSLEKRRAEVHLWTLAYQRVIARLYNRRV
ncbi:hypothetical protein BHM03_00033976 [Ensete ventricosum]|nr:hypothetical protein BHM03_00033976 [Ensete ventricosum]